MYVAACIVVFFACYGLTIVTTSIGFHRGLAHRAVRIRPAFQWLLLATGNWITGIDPKAWVVMHRLHHMYSDKPEDPHSPVNVGMLGILKEQLKSYNKTLDGLWRSDERYTSVARDLDFPLSWPIRTKTWFMPYLIHVAVMVALGMGAGMWWLGIAYFTGMMSHAVQGGIINSFGHAVGGRNFDSDDNSRNNHPAAWILLGEGYQNNHHRFPASARFSYRWPEVDPGYAVCLTLEKMGVLDIERRTLNPRFTSSAERSAAAAEPVVATT